MELKAEREKNEAYRAEAEAALKKSTTKPSSTKPKKRNVPGMGEEELKKKGRSKKPSVEHLP